MGHGRPARLDESLKGRCAWRDRLSPACCLPLASSLITAKGRGRSAQSDKSRKRRGAWRVCHLCDLHAPLAIRHLPVARRDQGARPSCPIGQEREAALHATCPPVTCRPLLPGT